ncbi:hypothetical protein ACSBR1_001537 [Camellia fascicularis]
MFLICEHSHIVKPERGNVMPRFCKWNIGTLIGRLKGANLRAKESIKVNCDKIVGTSNKCYLFKPAQIGKEASQSEEIVLDVDPINVWVRHGINVSMTDVEPSFDWWQPNSPNGGNVKMDGVCENENCNSRTPNVKKNIGKKILAAEEAWPMLFQDLLDL